MLTSELDDEYLQVVEGHLKELGFRRGTLISAGLGRGNKRLNYVLRKAGEQGWRDRIPIGNRQGYSFSIPDRDDNGHRALSDLRSRGLNGAANAHGRMSRTGRDSSSFPPIMCATTSRTLRRAGAVPAQPASLFLCAPAFRAK
jgi:hypothetical protein